MSLLIIMFNTIIIIHVLLYIFMNINFVLKNFENMKQNATNLI